MCVAKRRENKMDNVLKQIEQGEFKQPPVPRVRRRFTPYARDPAKTDEERKQRWYAIGKVVYEGHTVKLHKESKLAAKRTYIYYHDKGNWIGPTARQFGKMNLAQFQKELEEKEVVRQMLLEDEIEEEIQQMFSQDEAEGPASFEGGNLLTEGIEQGIEQGETGTPRDRITWDHEG